MDKRKLAAALALGGAIAIGSLFSGGDDPVSGSYRGGYYAGAGSYRDGYGSRTIQLNMPIYGLFAVGNASDPLPAAYYDSLAYFDVTQCPISFLVNGRYDSIVDSVRARNPDWIPLIHTNVRAVSTTWAGSDPGTFYREVYDMVEAGNYWMEDINGQKVPNPTYMDQNLLQYGAIGLMDSLAAIFFRHLDDADNLRPRMGVIIDSQNYPEESSAFDFSLGDIDKDGIPYFDNPALQDTADENTFILESILEAPVAFSLASGRSDFMVVTNGTCPHQEAFAWQYDGGILEHYNEFFPFDETDFVNVMKYASTWFDNSKVSPPLLLFMAHEDSTGLTGEAFATIANGVVMFSLSENKELAAGVLIDLDRPTDDNHLEIGNRIYDSVSITLLGEGTSIATAKFFDGSDTTEVTTRGYKGDMPWPYLIYNKTTGDSLSIGSRRITDCTNEVDGSYQFSDPAYWVDASTYWTYATGESDPWGGSDATKFTGTASVVNAAIRQSDMAQWNYVGDLVASAYVKNGNLSTSDKTRLRVINQTAPANLGDVHITWAATPTVAHSGDFIDSGITDMGGGWFHIWGIMDNTADADDLMAIRVYPCTTPSESDFMTVAGVQLEFGVTEPCGYYVQKP